METLYLTGQADVSRDEGTILVRTDGRKVRVPIEGVRHIVLTQEGTVSTKLLGLCGRAGVRMSFFDHYGWYLGAFEPKEGAHSGEVQVRQSLMTASPDGLVVAREIVGSAIDNAQANLRYHAYRGNDALKTSIEFMRRQRDGLRTAADKPTIMGIEGMSRRAYLEAWPLVDARLAFGTRVRRPPNNPINCLISFLNGVTYSMVRHEIAKTHLSDTVSFLHSPSQSRSSLSLDLSEPFKPLTTDAIIWGAVRKSKLDESWFDTPVENVCLLTQAGRRHFVDAFARIVDGPDGIRSAVRATALSLERCVLGVAPLEAHRRRV